MAVHMELGAAQKEQQIQWLLVQTTNPATPTNFLSPSAEDRLPKSFHFAESNLIIGVVRARSVHEVGYGHKWHWEA